MSNQSRGRTLFFARTRRLRLESLERRVLLAADLEITNAFLVDRFNNPIAAPVEGELAFVRAEWRTTDLNSSQQYVVHYEMDGITVASGTITGQAGVNLSYNWYRGVGFSAPGVRQVRVVVDGANLISETNESNNEFVFSFTPVITDIPEKMVFPIGGEPGKDWSVVNYTDVNLNTGQRQDFRGGAFQYDGHDAFDVTLPNFDRMDQGIPIFAAASGTVIEARDGNFDREIVGNNRPANYVAIDHGSGWVAYYYHFQRNTVSVEVGQSVSKGQMIGLTGSSGSSTDAHLHFSLYRNGSLVEPMFKPEDYFADVPIYQGDQAPSITASGITDRAPWDDFKEQPNDIRQFRSDGNKDTWFWYRLSHLNSGESLAIEWYRPSGVLDTIYDWTANGVARFGGHAWVRNTRVYEGTWAVVLKHAGVELTRETFEVIGSGGGPELDIRAGGTYIIDGRSTPINFGSTTAGNPAITRSFTISNRGTGNLIISDVDVPTGFQVVSSPATIAPGNSELLIVRMTTNAVGKKWGDLVIHNNDTDESLFRFGIEGSVLGGLPPGAASLQQDLPALAIESRLPQALFPEITIGNVTGLGLANGILTADIVSGKSATDKLLIQSQDIAVIGAEVLYQGNLVASIISNGSNGTLMLGLLASASVNVITEIARSIHFIDETTTPASRRRIVDLQIADSTNVTSNVLRRAVAYSDKLPEIDSVPPTISSVKVRSSGWSTSFINNIDSDGVGFELGATTPLPWANINQIIVQFSEPVVGFDETTVALLGVNVADYASVIQAVSYNAVTMQGLIVLGSPLVRDRLRIAVSDEVTDVAGNALDGNSDETSGGVFGQLFNVLVGDANGDGTTSAIDLAPFSATFNQGVGSGSYNPRLDWNGDGSVTAADFATFGPMFNTSLPSGTPAMPSFGGGSESAAFGSGSSGSNKSVAAKDALFGRIGGGIKLLDEEDGFF